MVNLTINGEKGRQSGDMVFLEQQQYQVIIQHEIQVCDVHLLAQLKHN